MSNFDNEFERQRKAAAAEYETPERALRRRQGVERGIQRELMNQSAYKKMRKIIYDPSIEEALWKIARRRIEQTEAYSSDSGTPYLHRMDVDTSFLKKGDESRIDIYTESDKWHLNMRYVRAEIKRRLERGFAVDVRLPGESNFIASVAINCRIDDLPIIGRTEFDTHVHALGFYQEVKNPLRASQIVQAQAAVAVKAFW